MPPGKIFPARTTHACGDCRAFRLRFLSCAVDHCVGEITLGEFTEKFEAPLGYWQREDYESQWTAAIQTLVGGERTAFFVTGMYDPAHTNYFFWWVAYRDDDASVFQNHLLLREMAPVPIKSIEDFAQCIPPYESATEDGNRISEWRVKLADVLA